MLCCLFSCRLTRSVFFFVFAARATRWLKPTIEAIADQLPEGAGNVRGAHIAALDEASEL